MRIAWMVPLLLAVGCSKQPSTPGGASPDEVLQRWTDAIRSSDFDAAARLMAPGYKEHWLVCTLAMLPWFGMADPELPKSIRRVEEKHGFTLSGLSYRSALEEQHLEAIRERLAVVEDPDALVADVLRMTVEMTARVMAKAETGYPQDRGRKLDWSGPWEGTRTVEVDGRWFVVLPLPTESGPDVEPD